MHERVLKTQYEHDHFNLDKKENDEWKEIYDQPYKYELTNDTLVWMKQLQRKDNDTDDEETIY